MTSEILCVARGHRDHWEAMCLDFDIAVQGQSFDEVRALLTEAIVTYLRDAQAETEPDRTRLLGRSVPLHVRLLWAWRFFRAALTGRIRGGDTAVGFPVTCPV